MLSVASTYDLVDAPIRKYYILSHRIEINQSSIDLKQKIPCEHFKLTKFDNGIHEDFKLTTRDNIARGDFKLTTCDNVEHEEG